MPFPNIKSRESVETSVCHLLLRQSLLLLTVPSSFSPSPMGQGTMVTSLSYVIRMWKLSLRGTKL